MPSFAPDSASPVFSARPVRPLLTVASLLASLLALAGLGGCSSIAPGMHFNAAEVAREAGGGRPGVVPQVRTITAELVRAEQAEREAQTVQDIGALTAQPAPYAIQSGDVLSIVVWDHPELAAPALPEGAGGVGGAPGGTLAAADAMPPAGFVVDRNGMIQFPFTGGLKVAGLTEGQARTVLAEKLSRYIQRPEVTLRVQSYRAKRVYIGGEVRTPGLLPINDIPMTLPEAISRAGGLLPSADQSQLAITRGGKTFRVSLLQLLQQGVNPSSILLENGDAVRVLPREQSKVFVSGEVVTPRALPMHDGRLTLNEALGEAGGINPQTADGRQIFVIRNAASSQPVVYHLDTRSPAGLSLAEEFPLRPKDVVYVDAAALTTWHRVISLIFPSALSSAVQANNTTPTR